MAYFQLYFIGFEFDLLNISWEKYNINNQTDIVIQNQKYEFHCFYCKKFLRNKVQLVDVNFLIFFFISDNLISKA